MIIITINCHFSAAIVHIDVLFLLLQTVPHEFVHSVRVQCNTITHWLLCNRNLSIYKILSYWRAERERSYIQMKSQQIRLIKYNFLPLVINYCINQRHEEFIEFQVCLNHFMSYELKIKLFVSQTHRLNDFFFSVPNNKVQQWFIHSSYNIDDSRLLTIRKVLFQHESISQTFLL